MNKTIVAGLALLGIGVCVGIYIANQSSKLSAPPSSVPAPDTRVERAPSAQTQNTAQVAQQEAPAQSAPPAQKSPWDENAVPPVQPPTTEMLPSEPLTESQLAQLRELTRNAEEYAKTFESSGSSDYVPPEIPPEIEAKLAAISPELVTLIRIATRIPPREVRQAPAE